MDPDSEGNTDSHPISTQGYHLHNSQFCKKGQAEANVPSSSAYPVSIFHSGPRCVQKGLGTDMARCCSAQAASGLSLSSSPSKWDLVEPVPSVADSHHIDADPYPACHHDADPDPASHFDADADPDPDFHFDANPDPDPSFQIKP